jgi:hypothetical protein
MRYFITFSPASLKNKMGRSTIFKDGEMLSIIGYLLGNGGLA